MIDILNSENIGHNLTEEELRQLQNHLMKMFRDVESVCKRHNLKVCIAYGNVIGAMRHGGWIPWDDDMDIHMSRKDYELFLTKYAKELPPQYIVSSYLTEGGSISRFAKIIDTSTVFVPIGAKKTKYSGVDIDIFPIDNTPKSTTLNFIRKYWAYFMMYTATSVMQYLDGTKRYKQMMFKTREGKRNWYFRQYWGFLFSLIPPKEWHRRIEKFAIHRKETGYCHVIADLDVCFKKIPSEYYFPFREIETKDLGKVCVPNKYDEYLQLTYGDWHKIPESSQRWHHWVDEFKI